MEDRAASCVLAPGESRRHDAISRFKAPASDTGGLLSACEFTLAPWESGPVLHLHTSVDEAFYVAAGHLELQLDDQRVEAAAGGFVWVPRGQRTPSPTPGQSRCRCSPLRFRAAWKSSSPSKQPTLQLSRARPTRRCWIRSARATALEQLSGRSRAHDHPGSS